MVAQGSESKCSKCQVGTASLPSYSICQSSHRACPDSQGGDRGTLMSCWEKCQRILEPLQSPKEGMIHSDTCSTERTKIRAGKWTLDLTIPSSTWTILRSVQCSSWGRRQIRVFEKRIEDYHSSEILMEGKGHIELKPEEEARGRESCFRKEKQNKTLIGWKEGIREGRISWKPRMEKRERRS